MTKAFVPERTVVEGRRDIDRTSAGVASTPPRLTGALIGAVVLVTGIAPLATDMYVPAFPAVGRDLAAGPSLVQLTLTTFFVAMAVGQLVGGPLSDVHGRRRPLLASLIVFTLASIACALSPSIPLLLLARALQGLSGGWAMVVARAIVVDLAKGKELVRTLNVVAGIGGVAPVVGPLLGGLILQLSHWRISFWLLAALAAAMVVGVLAVVPESLPKDQRHENGLADLVGSARRVVSHRRFRGYLVVFAVSMGVTFAYVATSAYILQSMNGVSPLIYSTLFALNAVGLAGSQLLAARLAGTVSTNRLIAVGLAGTAVSGIALLVGALWLGTPLWLAVIAFFVLMTAQGLIGPNAGALASEQVPDQAGTGSAVLGFLQWCAAGVVAPLAGLGGDRTAVPMAAIILALTALAAWALLTLAVPRRTHGHP